jgi:hypothetical protein
LNVVDDWKSRMAASDSTADMRIADSMQEIARYVGEIKQMLEELAARPDVDNAQLQRIAVAASEIQRLVPALLQR